MDFNATTVLQIMSSFRLKGHSLKMNAVALQNILGARNPAPEKRPFNTMETGTIYPPELRTIY